MVVRRFRRQDTPSDDQSTKSLDDSHDYDKKVKTTKRRSHSDKSDYSLDSMRDSGDDWDKKVKRTKKIFNSDDDDSNLSEHSVDS